MAVKIWLLLSIISSTNVKGHLNYLTALLQRILILLEIKRAHWMRPFYLLVRSHLIVCFTQTAVMNAVSEIDD